MLVRSWVSKFCLSVCLSVHQSVTRALWLIQRTYLRYFYTIWKSNCSSFFVTQIGWWAMSPCTQNRRSKWPIPFKNCWRRQISACSVTTVIASEKSSIMTNKKSYMGFPFQRAIDEMPALPLSPQRVAQKAIFLVFLNKIQFQSNEVCYKVFFR